MSALRILASGGDDRGAFFQAHKPEEHGGIDGGKQRVDFQAQFVGELVEIDAAALIAQNFEQAGHAAGTRVRQHDQP